MIFFSGLSSLFFKINAINLLAPEDPKQGTLSKDRTAGHHHGNKAKKMEVAWAC